MKKTALTVLVLAAALGAALVLYYYHQAPLTPAPMTALPIQTLIISSAAGEPLATIAAEAASSEAERELGLGNRTNLAEGRGMWFVFARDDYWPFWMKDTLIPLDILWVAADGTVVTVARSVEPATYPAVFRPAKPARYVLELPGGYAARHGIAEGAKIVVQ